VQREDWDRRYAEVENLWAVKPNRFLVAETEALEPGRALDLACGEGQNAIWLASRGWDVTGVDFSEVALVKAAELARARGVEVEWVAADVLEHEPPPGAFDLVAVLYLQLPRDELALALQNAVRAVAPGGTVVVLGHDTRNLTDGYGGPRDASVLFTPADVVASLDGLTVERAETVERTVTHDDGEAVALDAFVRAARAA
jgi:SAM-dependent methyltransferase